ncbi:GPN-loop GTPase 3-like [Saccoglossus kowalevskii]|uniref:GPN-loop GTPase 3 n=1 Tax=Saccoglossus kowalevskii TaxID=10224 RepID=A0ABM0GT61_SACKO|nr:PREDICTED: GPN-loop GTPase 3-like [Saccoglossus kowalevskii]
MPRYAQLVMGPAGSGKSTYCNMLQEHCEMLKRATHVINLDPAAENFIYQPIADIRDLIQIDDVMEDESLKFGPNGGLVFCMEYFAQNFDWLEEQLGDMEDDYIIFDCPGQIELYTHLPVMRQLVDQLQSWDFRVCGVFLIDSQFLVETSKFFSGILSALSAMVNLEIPHINVMSKMDLLSGQAKKDVEEKYLEPDPDLLLAETEYFGKKYEKLNQAIATVISDYSLVKFYPLDRSDEESINVILYNIDNSIQYGEDLEPKDTFRDEEDKEEDVDEPDIP